MKILYLPSKDSRSTNFNEFIKTEFPQLQEEKNPELLLISGGDGALLHAIQEYNHLQIPFMGRAAGTLNFLMNEFPKPTQEIQKILSDKTKPDILKTNSICVHIKKRGKKEWQKVGYAVNEVILGSNIMGFHSFEIQAPEQGFDEFDLKGTGISISTSLGSTGYNFNLGGPVIPLDSKYWVVKGIVTNKYLEDIIRIDKVEIEIRSNRTPTHIFKDGIKVRAELKEGDKIMLKKGQSIKLAFLNEDLFRKKRLNIAARYRK